MNTVLYIRKEILGISQDALAKIANTSQASVARWESGASFPDLNQMRMIRESVMEKGMAWDDKLFFEQPAADQSVHQEKGVALAV